MKKNATTKETTKSTPATTNTPSRVPKSPKKTSATTRKPQEEPNMSLTADFSLVSDIKPSKKKLLEKYGKQIKEGQKDIITGAFKMACALYNVKQQALFKDEYKNIYDFAEERHGISRAQCCNSINLCKNYAKFDENGEAIAIKREYRMFNYSQLIEMMTAPSEVLEQVDESTPVKKIREMKKSAKEDAPTPQDDKVSSSKNENKPSKMRPKSLCKVPSLDDLLEMDNLNDIKEQLKTL